MIKIVTSDIFSISIDFLGLRIKYYLLNFFAVANILGIEQLVKVWQLLLISQTYFKGPIKNDWKLSFLVKFRIL